MRVLLIHISDRIYGCNIRVLHAGLKRHGHDTSLFLLTDDMPETLSAAARHAMQLSPDIVGFSVMTDVSRATADLSRMIRDTMDVPILWGGIHATLDPAGSLRHADHVFIGEADHTLPGFLESFKANQSVECDGIISRKDQPDRTPVFSAPVADLDTLPFASLDWESHTVFERGRVFKDQSDQEQRLGYAFHAIFSRGCPFNCTYCYNNVLRRGVKGKGRYFRNMSVSRIFEEMNHAVHRFDRMERVFLWDDNFLARPEAELHAFADTYKRDIGKPIGLLGHPQNVRPDILRLLKDAGMDYFQMGIESGSEEVNRRIYGRRVSRRQILDAAQALHSLNLRELRYDLIFNNPFETPDHVRDTAALFLDIPRPYLVNGFNLIFFPGTDLYNRAMEQGLISDNPDGIVPSDTLFALRNSPVFSPLDHAISRKLYAVHYDDHDKRHLNLLIFLIVGTKVPLGLIRFLLSRDGVVSRVLPRLITKVVLARRFFQRGARHSRRPHESAAQHE